MKSNYSRYDNMMHPDVTDNDRYLSSVLDAFFRTKASFRDNYQELKARQTAAN